jgi:hypothetical protein
LHLLILLLLLLLLQYSHMDFVWDRNARHMVDLVDLMFRYAPSTF